MRAAAALLAALALAGCALLAALALVGCALPRPPPRLPECPGPLPDAGAIPGGDFALRERVRISGPGVDAALEIVAERRGARLVLVGFDPLGVRALSAVQEGDRAEGESHLGRALPIAPLDVLRDLHAARLHGEDDGAPLTVSRPGCAHRTHFVRLERRALD